jgi:type II secretory pathway pseudopilin PulG
MIGIVYEKKKNLYRGFSIIETMTVISVFTLVMVVLSASVISFYRTNAYSIEQSSAVESGRRGVDKLTRDLREATFSDEGSYPIVEIASNSITFYSNIDSDSGIEWVRYYLDGSTLYREIRKASGTPLRYPSTPGEVSVISEHVRNPLQNMPIFRYFDTEGNQLTEYTSVASVSFVQVNLVVNVNPQKLPNEFVIRSSATLRNIRGE